MNELSKKLKYLKYLCAAGMALFALGGQATPLTIDVDGNIAGLEISLTGSLEVDVEIEFEGDLVGLNTSNLNVTANVVSLLDLSLLSRLPSGLVLPTLFPVMITIEPPSTGGLSFSDAYTIELHTHSLAYVTDTPFRLMKAPLGGDFYDITEYVGAGSIRARGSSGGFSQFMIMLDLRSHDSVAQLKIDELRDIVDDASLGSTLDTDLHDLLDDTEDALDLDEYLDAIDAIEDFVDLVETNAGSNIPNVWRSARDLDNFAGEMLGWARSLRFSLNAAHNLTL